jgi:hypothetical protein
MHEDVWGSGGIPSPIAVNSVKCLMIFQYFTLYIAEL